jgi:exopolysaccharide production protein ExoZ
MLRRTAEQNSSLQQLRGVAAIMVLLVHASFFLERMRGSSAFFQVFDVRFGVYGVCFFFALSGYLMAGAIRRQDSSHFLVARMVRIYPMFFLATGCMAVIYSTFSMAFSLHPMGLLLMPYTPNAIAPLGGVEWTLAYEMTFYVVLFAIAAAGLTSFVPVLAALWTIAIAVVGIAWWPNQEWAIARPIYEMLLLLPSLGFAGGLLIPQTKAAAPVGLAVLACVIAMAIYGYIDRTISIYLAGACAVILVASLAARNEITALGSVGRCLNIVGEKLGDWSYALYLCHMPICILVYAQLPAFVPAHLAFAMALAVAIAAAALLGTIDVELCKRAKNILRAVPPIPVRALSGLYFIVFISFSAITADRLRSDEIAIANATKLATTLLPITEGDATLMGHLDLLRFEKNRGLTAAGWAFNRADPHRPVLSQSH